MPAKRLRFYKLQIRSYMEYCSHIWKGAPLYQLCPLECIQRRATRIVNNRPFSDRHDLLALRREVNSLCSPIAFIMGNVPRDYSAQFRLLNSTIRHHAKIRSFILTILISGMRFSRHFFSSHNYTVEAIASRCISLPIRLGTLKKNFFFLQKPATYLQDPWYCSCSWKMITYNQVSLLPVCPLFYKKILYAFVSTQ